MEAKTELSKKRVTKSPKLLTVLSSTALLLISGISRAADTLATTIVTPDSLAKDTTNAGLNAKGLRALDEGGILTYSLIIVGIIVIIGFAFVTSMRKNKPSSGAPVGYRKPTTHHKHHHKI